MLTVEWISCLNTLQCRREIASKVLRLPPIVNVQWPVSPSSLSSSLWDRAFPSYVCIVKRTGPNEVHWVSVVAESRAKVVFFNSSCRYDVRDVKDCISSLCQSRNCDFVSAPTTHLQCKSDFGCQTWSLVFLAAHKQRRTPTRKLYQTLVSKIARSTVMKVWLRDSVPCGAGRG